MSIQLTIRNVPKEVRDELASRAALQHKSMQEFLREELQRIASKPTIDSWLRAVRERKQASETQIPVAKILAERNTDRR